MSSYIQVLGHQPSVVSPQLLIAKNQIRILVNAGENTQRFSLEHKIKVSKISDILITHVALSTLFGLPGLLLTLEMGDTCQTSDDPDESLGLPTLTRKWQSFSNSLHERCLSFHRPLADTRQSIGMLRKVRVWGPPPLKQFIAWVVAEFAPLRHLNLEVYIIKPLDLSPVEIKIPLERARDDDDDLAEISKVDVNAPVEGDIAIHASKRRRLYQSMRADMSSPPSDCRETPYQSHSLLSLTDEQIGNLHDDNMTSHVELIGNQLAQEKCSYQMIIVGEMPKQLAKMNSERLLELKIPKGPWLASLKKGEAVTLSDGRKISPKDVCGDSKEGEIFMISHITNDFNIDRAVCPSLIQSLLCFPMDRFTAIFDLSTEELRRSVFFKSLVTQLFGDLSAPIPVVACSSNDLIPIAQPFVSSTALQSVLRSVAPVFFPLGILDSFSHRESEPLDTSDVDDTVGSHLQIIKAQLLDRWNLAPTKESGMDISNRLQELRPQYESQRLNRLSEVQKEVDACTEKLFRISSEWTKKLKQISDASSDNQVFVRFLGTGSAMPSKYRNVSGILIRVIGDLRSSYLFDCGEGTLSQILRFSSSIDEYLMTIESLTMIFISHRHADHHLGLPSILEERQKRFPHLKPPHIIAPSNLSAWIKFINNQISNCQARFIPCDKLPRIEFLKSPSKNMNENYHVKVNKDPMVTSRDVLSENKNVKESAKPVKHIILSPTEDQGCVAGMKMMNGERGQCHSTIGTECITVSLCTVDHIQEYTSMAKIKHFDKSEISGTSTKSVKAGCYAIRLNIPKCRLNSTHSGSLIQGISGRPPLCGNVSGKGLVSPYDEFDVAVKLANPLTEEIQVNESRTMSDYVSNEWSVVYSGDTRPCDNLVELAQCCDVLIHEGTFEDNCQGEAKRKRHSTMGEAMEVAKMSNAKFLLLTHFSQRYPAMPLLDATSTMTNRTIVVFDGLQVPVNCLIEADPQEQTDIADSFKLLKPILTQLRDE